MTARWQNAFVHKELRALGPVWLASAALALLGAALRPGGAFIGYAAGTFFLAAMSIGHEYTSRTLPALLTQPVSRRQVFITKMLVVVALVAALAALTTVIDFASLDRLWPSQAGYAKSRHAGLTTSLNVGPAMALLLPALAALCLAPLFTMISRGPLGGIVFSAATFGLVWLGGDLIGTFRFTPRPEDSHVLSVLSHPKLMKAYAFRTGFVWWTTSIVSFAGAVLAWRTFVRLEANEGSSSRPASQARRNVSAPEGARLSMTRRPWWVQVARKELHLQKMIFVIAALYVVCWCALSWSARVLPVMPVLLTPLSFVYAAAVALLLGSFASAEERQLGTHNWQMLMPVSARRQWTVKVAVVCGLCLLLGFALPWALESTALLPNDVDSMRDESAAFTTSRTSAGAIIPIALTGLAIASLYVSSAATAGLRALMASLAAAAPVMGAGIGLIWLFNTTSRSAVSVLRDWGWYRSGAFRAIEGLVDLKSSERVALVAMIALAVVLLRLALKNHASADRNPKRVWRQLGWVSASAVVFAFVVGSLQAATLDDWQTTGSRGFRVRGHIKLEGNTPAPKNEPFYGSIEVVPVDAPRMDWGWGIFDRRLAFRTTYSWPGRSLINIRAMDTGPWALKSVTYRGRDITEGTLDVTADLDDVVVTLSDQLGRIEGKVDDTSAHVYLFPADPALWPDKVVMNRRFGHHWPTTKSAVRGVFTFDMPPDGDYLIVAVDRMISSLLSIVHVPGDRQVAALAEIAPFATRIQARQGATIKMSLSVKRQPAPLSADGGGPRQAVTPSVATRR